MKDHIKVDCPVSLQPNPYNDQPGMDIYAAPPLN